MGKLIVNNWMSLDGVVQAPGLEDEDPSGGFEHGGWVTRHFDQRMGELVVEQLTSADAILYGRRTFEIFASYWPNVTDRDVDAPIAEVLGATPKYVASTTLREPLGWRDTHLLDDDVPTAVAALKEQHDEVLVTGSARLAQTLTAHGLVDEYHLWTFPVLLGGGKRLFAQGTPAGRLTLLETEASQTGVVMSSYAARR